MAVSGWVVEFDRPREKASKDGAKTDELDAVRAARETLGRDRLHVPRAHDEHREALRVHTVTRAGVVRARTAAINELKALVLTAPDDLRQELRHPMTWRMNRAVGSISLAMVATAKRRPSGENDAVSEKMTAQEWRQFGWPDEQRHLTCPRWS